MSSAVPAASSSHALYRQQSVIALPSVQPIAADAVHVRLQRIAEHLAVAAFVFALCWLAHFSQAKNIGFYSDDHTFALHMLSSSTEDFIIWLKTQAIQYPEPQGRPLGFFLGVTLPYLANRAGGVDAMFVAGWLILSTNALLLYYLLRRCFPQPLPFLAAIFFILFPADTTRSFLCHLHILQPSLTFMLIAGHLYLNGNRARRVLAYFVVTLCLITYETALLPFLAIPLLEKSFDRAWRKRVATHLATLFLIIAFIGITRQLGGEYRAVEANGSKLTVLLCVVAGSFIGPCVAAAACFWRIITATLYLAHSTLAALILLAGSIASGMAIWLAAKSRSSTIPITHLKSAALFGLGATFVSYILCFTHFPPNCMTGQLTSEHLATAIGGSTLMAVIATALLNLRSTVRWKMISISIIAIYIGILLVNANWEQDGYVKIWQERQQFWTRVIDLCPDLNDRTLILCDGQLPQPSKLMPASSWSDTQVLGQTLDFPATFTLKPQLMLFAPDSTGDGWRTYLSRNSQGRVIWSKFVVGVRDGVELVEGNTILLHIDAGGNVLRVNGTVDIAGKPFRLKSLVHRGVPRYPVLPFYKVLVQAGR